MAAWCDKDGENSANRRELEQTGQRKRERERIDYEGKTAQCRHAPSTGPRSRVSLLPSWLCRRVRADENRQRRERERERKEEGRERERKKDESSSLCPCSLEFLGDTGGRIRIINYDLLQWQRLRSVDYLTVMSARYNYIYISFVMEYRASIAKRAN